MARCTLAILFVMVVFTLQAQENPFTDSLKRNLEQSRSNAEKIKWLGQLSAFYLPLDKKLSDDYNNQLFRIAETSRDRELMVWAILSDARRHYNMSGRQDNITTGIEFSQKALDLAKASSLNKLQAWSHIYLALGSRLNGDNDKALNHNNLALSLLNTVEDDSLTVNAYNSIGSTYLLKNEKMLAFRNYLEALRVAEETDNYYLMRSCYNNLSAFYADLEEYEKAKDYLFKNLALTHRFKRKIERVDVYNTLGRVYAQNKQFDLALEYYEKSIALTDTLKFELLKVNAYSNILNMYVGNNEMKKALDFFSSKPQLKSYMLTAGFDHFIYQAYGIAYAYIGRMDSAYYYLKKAEPAFETKASKYNKYYFYTNMAFYYTKKKDYKNALAYYKKAQVIGEETKSLDLKKQINQKLDSAYQRLGDFKSAYLHKHYHQQFTDSLEKLSAEKDLMLMEVENENKRKERDALQAEEGKRARHSIQYMGITAAIAGVFILLVMFGIFSVSHATIRILGFFAFIFLFEFIILLADNQIHHWTHGEPWKILAIKIGLISILLPLHHFMEEKVIHYLTSRKMLELNTNAILSRFVHKKEAESTPTNP